MKEYFRILRKIPKGHFGIPILLSVGLIFFNQYLLNEESKINYDRLWILSLLLLGVIFLWVQFQWTRFALKELQVKTTNTNTKSSPPLRHLNNSITLEPYIIERILIQLSVTRRWYPDAGIPSATDFIKDLSIDDFLCYKCKHNYVSRPGKIRYSNEEYYCSNEKCVNKEYYHEHEWNSLINKAKFEIKGDIRNNTEKYWEMYTKEYLKLTKNKPELYDRPSTTYTSNFI